MAVYVISKDGQPLMPTERYGKVRRMLKEGKAKVVKRCPFTIRLLYETGKEVQEIRLGVDAGSGTVGLSACTEKKELYAGEVTLRTDITKNLAQRREYRRGRRYRKTRYRQARFSNRVKAKHKGWLAPSVEAKVQSHVKAVEDICGILPISQIIVETASFDIQAIKAEMEGKPLPEGTDYQKGEQLGFWNLREYILYRDNHTCQCCKGKRKDRILNVHHIESRQTGGDAPNNLITLCGTCHKKYHRGEITLPEEIRRGAVFRDAAFMGIMRKTVLKRLEEKYPGKVTETYGYLTKNRRIRRSMEKDHMADARIISGYPDAEPAKEWYYQKKVRCHNRQLRKANTLKGGIVKANQTAKEVSGYRLFDRVEYKGEECFVFGRRTRGYFNLRHLDGSIVHTDASHKQLRLLEHSGTTLTERRKRDTVTA